MLQCSVAVLCLLMYTLDGVSSDKEAKISFLRYIGCLNFIKDHTKHGLLQIQALVPLLNFLNCRLLVLLH